MKLLLGMALGTYLFVGTSQAGAQVSQSWRHTYEAACRRRDRWIEAHFGPLKPPVTCQPAFGLNVLQNYGDVQRNGRDGKPLRIAGQTFEKGLYCHAESRALIRLPGPAQSFSAVIGGETNGNFTGGTIRFSVESQGNILYQSPVMKRGHAGIAIDVPLHGAAQFELVVDNGGDNVNSDQACWGNAKVKFRNGRSFWVSDLPNFNARVGRQAPFSFLLDGKPSDVLLPKWRMRTTKSTVPHGSTKRIWVFSDPVSNVEMRCEAVVYADFPVVEWTAFLRNNGKTDSPVLSEIRPLDAWLERAETLHHFTGSPAGPNDYEPFEAALTPGFAKQIATSGGRPTNAALPYFNVAGRRGGIIVALGWPGQWLAEFDLGHGPGLHVSAGQEFTHFRLHPGEEVRTPLSVLLFYDGDWIAGQNIWRRWMIAQNVPKLDGKPIRPTMAACNGNHYPGIITNAAEEKHFLQRYLDEGIRPDFWWEDAGWYKCGEPPEWTKTGTWEVDPSRWPKGIREVSDWCLERGMRTIVWFEPERVAAGSWLAENRPNWVLGGKNGGLLNLGDPACRKWTTDRIDQLINQQGIHLYRQDFNIDPLPYWKSHDTPDRQGVTEIRHVEGYLAFWDELRRRHPGMLIDSCASGGRRNDLETLRRAVPLLRSDYLFEAVGEQGHTYGISFWMPFNGTGFLTIDPYLIRSQMSPEFTLGVDTRIKDQDYGLLRKLVSEWRALSPCYLGDYYPLTPYSLADERWMAWQFDRPELGRGFFQAFRRAGSSGDKLVVKLRGLDPKGVYRVQNLDEMGGVPYTGAQLMKGFVAIAKQKPCALVFAYRRVDLGRASSRVRKYLPSQSSDIH